MAGRAWPRPPCPAGAAQYASGPSATIEVASDERRRGLSWSDGDPVLRGSLSVPVAQGLSLDGAATSLWGSDRHGGADAVIDLGPSYVHQLGGWRLSLDARYHLFPGADHQGYGEFGAGAGFLIGPASIDIGAQYAPRQSAIGGDNLYLSSAASFAIPGTPLTASARVGHSSGSDRDPLASQRLRRAAIIGIMARPSPGIVAAGRRSCATATPTLTGATRATAGRLSSGRSA
ncbi:TorF family putative porin [Sphingobium scionense]